MVLYHDQTEIFCEWNSQNAIKLRLSRLPPFVVSVCQGEIFFLEMSVPKQAWPLSVSSVYHVKLLEGVKDGRREVHEMSKRQRNGGVCFSETGFSASFLFPLTGSKKEKKKTA